ncbi:MAG TPA: class I SAM-dependent methyltransferase [Gemmatimonadales bacterium]|nr:class I SAM-dependent methyltransferase [Gemmatimonadales bacterium]
MPRLSECPVCSEIPWTPWARQRCLCEGFNLDLGCGEGKQKGFIGMDRRPLRTVDIVWDIESVTPVPFWARGLESLMAPNGKSLARSEPWPIPDNSVDKLLCSHVLEHITPSVLPAVMDEMWRVMRWDGQVLIAVPHGDSYGFRQDPTHIGMFNESTMEYFDPAHGLWQIYKPKPWLIRRQHSSPYHNMEIVLEPRKQPNGEPVDIHVQKPPARVRRKVSR